MVRAFTLVELLVVISIIALLPHSSASELCERARAAMREGRCDQAIPWLESAVEAEPNEVSSRALLAEAYERTGEQTKAVVQYEQVGDLYAAGDKPALAAHAYERAIRLAPPQGRLHFKLAGAFLRAKQVLGQVAIRRVKGAAPGRIVKAHYLLEAVPGKKDTFRAAPAASAIYQVHKAVELGLDRPEVHRLRGDIWLRLHAYEQALSAYRMIDGKVSDADRAAFEFNFAQAALGMNDLQTYLDRLNQASELDRNTYGPKLIDGYRTAARHCNRRGDLPGTTRYLELAVQESPESPDLRYRLGNAYWEAGRPQDAAKQWQVTLELEPHHPNRSLMLSRIRAATDHGPG